MFCILVHSGSRHVENSKSRDSLNPPGCCFLLKEIDSFQMSWFYIPLETYGRSICLSSYWLLRKYFRARALPVTSSSHMELEVAAGWFRQSSIKNTRRVNRNQNGNVVTWQQILMERNHFNFIQQRPRFRDTASGRSQGIPS